LGRLPHPAFQLGQAESMRRVSNRAFPRHFPLGLSFKRLGQGLSGPPLTYWAGLGGVLERASLAAQQGIETRRVERPFLDGSHDARLSIQQLAASRMQRG